jgi:hypothetical protein
MHNHGFDSGPFGNLTSEMGRIQRYAVDSPDAFVQRELSLRDGLNDIRRVCLPQSRAKNKCFNHAANEQKG